MQRGLSAELTGGLYSPENDNPSVTALRAVPLPLHKGGLNMEEAISMASKYLDMCPPVLASL